MSSHGRERVMTEKGHAYTKETKEREFGRQRSMIHKKSERLKEVLETASLETLRNLHSDWLASYEVFECE